MPTFASEARSDDGSARARRLNRLVELARRQNRFQRDRLGDRPIFSVNEIGHLPLTGKGDLVSDQQAHPPFGTNLSFPLAAYTHLHQTSGTTGTTLRVLDTLEDWRWVQSCLAYVLAAAGITRHDRVALAYSFGPYLQFWASYAGVESTGALAISLGGMDSLQRVQTIRDYGASALLCTPSYATHLAHVALDNDLADALEPVQRIVCTGEPGASLPAVRDEIEHLWGARCFDHAGLSEVGPCAYPCDAGGGMHLLEHEYLFEVLDPSTREPVSEGATGELIVTALGRLGFPVIRYSTGDLVQPNPGPCPARHPGRWLPRGILGRTDDMVVIRGMNVFPSAIEELLRQSGGVGEFLITFYNEPPSMDEIKVEVELAEPTEARAIQSRLRQQLGLRVRVVPVRAGILPRQAGKSRRVRDIRARPNARRVVDPNAASYDC